MRGRVIAVTSAKGGVGKTTVCSRLGQAFALMGRRVVLVELTSGFRTADLMLRISDKAVYDLSDVFAGTCGGYEDAVVESDDVSGLFYLPAPQDADTEVAALAFARVLGQMRARYDHVILDMPPYTGEFNKTVCSQADVTVFVTTPDVISARSTHTLAKKCGGSQRLIINRLGVRPLAQEGVRDLDDVIDLSGVQLLGVLPEDPDGAAKALSGQMLSRGSLSKRIYNSIARRIEGEDIPLCVLNKRLSV